MDFDGTLAPIVENPADARLPAPTRRALTRLVGHARAQITIVSGRRRHDLIHRIDVPRIRYWGLFGWEQRGRQTIPRSAMAALRRARHQLEALAHGLAHVWIEDKTFAFTVHVRGASTTAKRRVRALLRDHVRPGSDLYATSGAQAWNVLPRQILNKGDAVGRAVRQAGGTAVAVYVGDDHTDEPAFVAAASGITVRVGGGRRTRARYRLPDVASVGRFLERLEKEL
jgi:trehalose 6-phosphate phosphatase